MSLDEFRGRMQYLYDRIIGAEKADGVNRIHCPRELEQVQQQLRGVISTTLLQAEIDTLNAGAEVGLKHLEIRPD